MIALEGVWKSYGDSVALRDATFSLGRGEVVVLTGPSGAGKSTLLRLLHGAELADRGSIKVAGYDLSRISRREVPYLRRTVGVVFQDFKLLRNRTVRENVELALEIREVPRREMRSRVDVALKAVDLLDRAETRVARLSGGEQQRVAVARAVVGEPEILLADEPTGNLDPLQSKELLSLFEALRGRGTTMILATHDHEVMAYALFHRWRQVRLERGAVVQTGDPYAPQAPKKGGEVIAMEAAMLRKLLDANKP